MAKGKYLRRKTLFGKNLTAIAATTTLFSSGDLDVGRWDLDEIPIELIGVQLQMDMAQAESEGWLWFGKSGQPDDYSSMFAAFNRYQQPQTAYSPSALVVNFATGGGKGFKIPAGDELHISTKCYVPGAVDVVFGVQAYVYYYPL